MLVKRVYPRWRGEHGRWADIQALCDGLSPLARGTLAIMYDELPKYRFIPAGAGNTESLWLAIMRTSVYPRWRGEHTNNRNIHGGDFGLSPLARGTRLNKRKFYCNQRFIPADAGNTT